MKKATILIIAILAAAFVVGLSFSSSPLINEGNDADTTESLVCEWTSNGDTTSTNVTWYRDGSVFKTITDANSPSSILSSNTTRGQVWNCTVIIGNGTAILNQSDTIDIVNADPGPLFIYNSSGEDIGNSTTILEDVAYTFDVNSTDPDGDSISYSTLNLPSGASFNSGTGVMTWTPEDDDEGPHNVTFIALDDQTPDRGSTAEDVIFTVQEVNDDPEFSPALQNQTATEGEPFSYIITVSDEESDFPINFSISSNLTLQINSTGSSTANISFIGLPSFEDRGNWTVEVNISDTRNGTASGTFILEVVPVNQPPTMGTVENISGTQGSPFSLVVNATDREPGDTLSFTIAGVNCPLSNPWSITKLDEVTQNNESFANASISLTLTNDHVVCNQVNVTVNDGSETDSQIAEFNITNTNDAPTVHELSFDSQNTFTENISNQQAFVNAQYIYYVNATDPDNLTYEGEILTYSDNTSLFNINSGTGRINFTPTEADIGNHTINITVSDDGSLSDSRIMNIEILNNTQPTILPFGNFTCLEDSLCTIVINATDLDGDNITYQSNTSIFNITEYNETSGIVNRTYNQSFVGTYQVYINATDARGATDFTTFTFTINNTNDAPVLDSINFPSPIVVNRSYTIFITADDQDIGLFGGGEPVNYSVDFLVGGNLFNVTTSFDSITNSSTGTIQFNPNQTEDGSYSVNISAFDDEGAFDSEIINFTVFNDTEPPEIEQIRPYGTPLNSSTVDAFANASEFPGLTNISVEENSTWLFNLTVTDDTTALENLTFNWTLDGAQYANGQGLSYDFDFFSSGNTEIRVIVYDDRLENSSFIWNVTVNNVNRPPLLLNPLENVTIDSTETFTKFLELRSDVKFIDPDDDLNGNDQLEVNETNTLTFNATDCSVATLNITGSDVKFRPVSLGTCTVNFTATDTGGVSIVSNNIQINVTEVPNSTTTTTETITVPSGGGGGGGGSASIIIPQEVEVDIPEPLNLVTPGEVTIYRNRTITIPVLLRNTWNDTITGVGLTASSNNTDVQIRWDQTYYETMEADEEIRAMMTVTNYRLGESFEVKVNASVEEPEFDDAALILFNSIEQTMSGEEVRIMVTFARDLLTSNEECQELGEVLNRAEGEFSNQNFAEARNLLDTVINGCRYLVSRSQVEPERPQRFTFNFVDNFNWFYAGAGFLLVAFIVGIVAIEYRIRKEETQ